MYIGLSDLQLTLQGWSAQGWHFQRSDQVNKSQDWPNQFLRKEMCGSNQNPCLYWASWCPAMIKTLPWLVAAYNGMMTSIKFVAKAMSGFFFGTCRKQKSNQFSFWNCSLAINPRLWIAQGNNHNTFWKKNKNNIIKCQKKGLQDK